MQLDQPTINVPCIAYDDFPFFPPVLIKWTDGSITNKIGKAENILFISMSIELWRVKLFPNEESWLKPYYYVQV